MQAWRKRGEAQSVLEAILARSEETEEDLLSPFPVAPEEVEGIPAAADLIVRCALQGGMPVVIVGDYDADGVTATAILVKLLRHLGVEPETIIPRRFTHGYGITTPLIQGISHSLLITVDNGIAAPEPIRVAKAAGNVVLILDHHLPQAELPPADVIVDPHLHPERNGYEHYCGAGLAYKLAEYLCGEEEPEEKKKLFFDLLVLACLGTLADVMPLTGDNRRLVMSGLQVINRESWYRQLSPGLRAVLDLASRPYTEDTIKFQTAPILNATGRLFDAGSSSVLKALLETGEAAAVAYAAKMKAINQRRKDLVAQWLAAVEEAAAGREEDPILLVRCQGIRRASWASWRESSARPTAGRPSSSPTSPAPPACSGAPAGPMGTLTSPPFSPLSPPLPRALGATPGPLASPCPRGSTAPWDRPSSSGPRATSPRRRTTPSTMTWTSPRPTSPRPCPSSRPMPPMVPGWRNRYWPCGDSASSPGGSSATASWARAASTCGSSGTPPTPWVSASPPTIWTWAAPAPWTCWGWWRQTSSGGRPSSSSSSTPSGPVPRTRRRPAPWSRPFEQKNREVPSHGRDFTVLSLSAALR